MTSDGYEVDTADLATTAAGDWTDAFELNAVASEVMWVEGPAQSGAGSDMPSLQGAAAHFLSVMRMAFRELSDAAEVLGSSTSRAAGRYQGNEAHSSALYARMTGAAAGPGPVR